jgi:16S rRNA processing protein RimM
VIPYWAESAALGRVSRLRIGGHDFRIATARRTHRAWLVMLEGVTTPERASRLAGLEVEAFRAELPALEPGEWYAADLIGLRAVDPHGSELGVIAAIHDFGAGDLLVLRDPNGDERWRPLQDGVLLDVRLDLGCAVLAPEAP